MVSGRATWAAALAEAGCHDFLASVVDKTLAAAWSRCPDGASLLGESARADLRHICLGRLGIVYERPLVRLAMGRVRPTTAFLLNAGGEAAAQAMAAIARGVAGEVTRDAGASLRASLPYAQGYEQTIASNFGDALVEFLDRLSSRRDDISRELLGSRPITRVEGLDASGADAHRHGRMVMRVATDAGRFYYKPHDCQLDALYLELVESRFSDCARAARIVPGEGFAFAEELVPQELAHEKELRTYWHNLGCLAALFHGLGSRDMTADNLTCCGPRPAALDLETLLVGEVPFDEAEVAAGDALSDLSPQALANSVACTAVLPMGTAGVRFSPLVADGVSAVCLPRVDGEPRTVRGFESDFSAGFERGYRRLTLCRDEVLSTLERHGTAVCRQVLLNTWAYAEVRAQLFGPAAMTDPLKRSEVLAESNEAYAVFGSELRGRVAKPDASALMEGDIPYYCSRACSRTLHGPDGGALGELVARPALEVARERLMRLSEDELRFELGLIQRCMA